MSSATTAQRTHRTGRSASGPASRTARRAQSKARRARNRPLVARLAVASVAARGVVYAVLAYIAADMAASGARGRRADSTGAFEELLRQPAGTEMVSLLALGLLAYAGWRFLQAVAGDPDASPPADVAKRVGWALIGVAYIGLFAQAVALLVGGGSRSGGAASLSRSLLARPGGRVALAVIGLAVVGAGIGLAVWAALQRFDSYLDHSELPQGLLPVLRVTETAGQLVRGLVFAGVGASFVIAAVADTARDAKDVDGALRTLRGQWFGQPVLALVAAGLAAFALSSFLEARYREA